MGLLLALAAIPMAAVAAWKFKHKLDWGDRTVDGLERTFDLGESRRFTYRAVAKRPSALEPLDITVRVRCEEVVFYNHGTDRQRRSKDFYQKKVEFDRHPDDKAVVLTGVIHIPADLPPSLDLRDNKIEWKVDFKLDPANGIQLKETIDFKVAPRIQQPGSEPSSVQQREWDDGTELIPPTPGDFYE